MPTLQPSLRISLRGGGRIGDGFDVKRDVLRPALTNRRRIRSGSEIIRCASKYALVALRIDSDDRRPEADVRARNGRPSRPGAGNPPRRETSSISRAELGESADKIGAAICGGGRAEGFCGHPQSLVQNIQREKCPFSRNSSDAPPPVLTWLTLSARPNLLDRRGAVAAADDA